ncbi:MAG: hypothetical protein ACR2FF_01805 [Mycobacteriales bacterium]|nr:MAG: hypothetical protein DLM56_02465 [Pseudonocardiales bacterium]
MALTAAHEQRLKDAGLVKFFEDNRAAYRALAVNAFDYTRRYVEGEDLPVRVDDVAAALELALRVSNRFEAYLASHRLTQQYWFSYFADLILDRLWSELAADLPPRRSRRGATR